MLRAMVWTLRQRRYATLAAIMAVLALGCLGAGTFELHRYHEKRHDNGVLRANFHAPASPLTPAMVPLTGSGPGSGRAPSALAIRYCTVTASGVFDAGTEQYLADRSQDGHEGFDVLTPLRTRDGVLLVDRGFVAADAAGTRPADVPAPPAGTVTVRGRLETASTGGTDGAGRLPRDEITAVVPAAQAARLGAPVYRAYVVASAGQPGTADLDPQPAPDLSNPTGGAGELQLLSYVIQWYVFALLALLAPFVFARADAREARLRFLGLDDGDVEFDLAADRAADLAADRGPGGALDGAPGGATAAALPGEADLVLRARSELARAGADARWERAERLADRYGRSLGPRPDADPAIRRAPALREAAGPDSATAPHRSADEYHGSYNDYLWSLAMADGNIPETLPDDDPPA